MKNAYIEITNVCNLSCSFCPGHSRQPRFMSAEELSAVVNKLDGKVENIFLHVMGEPLLHPELGAILERVDGMKNDCTLKITTNGTLLDEKLPLIMTSKRLKTLCISLHSFEANTDGGQFDKYISSCLEAASATAKKDKFAVLRLWNEGGSDSLNPKILDRIREKFPDGEWEKTRRGMRVARHVFVEFGEKFDWPDGEKDALCADADPAEPFDALETDCHALLTQVAILSDGTAVPCCLDRNGDIPLGNIFSQSLEEILSSKRAKKMRDSIAAHRACEKLCFSCGKRTGAFQK